MDGSYGLITENDIRYTFYARGPKFILDNYMSDIVAFEELSSDFIRINKKFNKSIYCQEYLSWVLLRLESTISHSTLAFINLINKTSFLAIIVRYQSSMHILKPSHSRSPFNSVKQYDLYFRIS